MSDYAAMLDGFASRWAEGIIRACWQGGLAILAVLALCRVLRKTPFAAKCWLWRLAYVKLLIALVWATPIALPLLPAGASQLPGAAAPVPTHGPTLPPIGTGERDLGHVNRAGKARISTAVSRIGSRNATRWLFAVWLFGTGCQAARLLRRWQNVRHLRSTLRPIDDPQLTVWVAEACRRFGLRRAPALKATDTCVSPLLLGVIRPVIVLPSSLLEDFSPAELRVALGHELAHWKRHDLIWNWLPTLVEALLFFHPLVWVARRQWRLAQELACDEMTVSASGASAAELGRLLLKLASRPHPKRSLCLLTAGVSQSFSMVKRRVIAMKHFNPLLRRRTTAVAVLLTLLLGIGGVVPWRVTAQEKSTAVARPQSTTASPTDAVPPCGLTSRLTTASPAEEKTNRRGTVVLPVEVDPEELLASVGARYKRTAVIDIDYIFKHYDRFTQLMNQQKEAARTAQARMEESRRQLSKRQRELREAEPASPEYRRLEAEVTRRKAVLQASIQSEQKRFLQEEARVYDAVYDEIVEEVACYAREHGIGIVVRCSSDGKSEDPRSVVRRINRPIVYQEDELDITLDILVRLNGKPAQPHESPGQE